jgi:uncharacterized RDD family membrane protein YckC
MSNDSSTSAQGVLDRPHAEAAATPVEGVAYGDVAARLLAYVLDALLVGVVIFAVAFVMTRLLGPTLRIAEADGAARATVDDGRAVLNAVVATLITGAYFVGSWSVMRGTPAQRLLGMRVVRASDGARLGPGQALVRWLLLGAPLGLASVVLFRAPASALLLGLISLVWYLVILATTARDRRKRGIHDRVAGSVVLRRMRIVGPAAASAPAAGEPGMERPRPALDAERPAGE